MRLPQMTTRWWIAAVAISATLLGVIVEINRELKLASQYRLEARMHGLLESASNGTVFRGSGAATGNVCARYRESRTGRLPCGDAS
jgi:hypothetical protein